MKLFYMRLKKLNWPLLAFWLSVLIGLSLFTSLWHYFINQPLNKKSEAIRSHIVQLQQPAPIRDIIPAEELRVEDLRNLNAVSNALQKAAPSGVNIINFSQGDSTPVSGVKNVQPAKLNGKRLATFPYTTQITGNYLQLLEFLQQLQLDKGIFIQSLSYSVNTYPEATLTLNFVVYNAIS